MGWVKPPLLHSYKGEDVDHKQVTEETKKFFEQCLEIQNTKGKDYTTDGDAFKDLNDEAEAMGVTVEQVLWIAMNKHYKAVRKFCKEGRVESEPIETRLMDLANYTSLIYAFIKERKEPK